MTLEGRHRNPLVRIGMLLSTLAAAPVLAAAQSPPPGGADSRSPTRQPAVATLPQSHASSRPLVGARLAQTFQQADVNRDGLIDIVVADFLADEVRVIVNEGNARLRKAMRLASGRGPRAIVAADFNQDGWPDVAVSHFLSGDIAVFLGEGGGRFSAARRVDIGAGLNAMVGADFTGDGQVDLAVANFISGDLLLLEGRIDGSFEPMGVVGQAPATSVLMVQEPADGGRPELLALDVTGGRAVRFVATEQGSLNAAGTESVASIALGSPDREDALAVATGDGRQLQKVSGDGQVAMVEDGALESFVLEIRSLDGVVSAADRVSFFDLTNDRMQQSTVSLVTDDQGRARLVLTLAALPENRIVAASGPSGQVILFSATSTLALEDLLVLGRLALAGTTLDQNSKSIHQAILVDVERMLSEDNETGAVRKLTESLAILGTDATPAIPTPESALGDLLRRFVNQLLLVGARGMSLASTLTCGVPVAGSIDAPGEVDVFTFSVSGTEHVEIHVGRTAGALSPLWRLLDGTGTPVAGACGVFGGARDCGPLLASGNPYSIEVVDNTLTKTGSYNINLERLTASATCPNATLTCGLPVAGNIEAPTDTDIFAFSVIEGERVEIHVGTTAGTLSPLWRLLNGTGTPVAGACSAFGGARDCGPLPASGNPYGIEVVDNTRTKTGTYNINLERLTAGATCANAALTCGVPVAGTIEAPADTDLFAFASSGSGTVRVSVTNTSGTLSPLWRLLDGTGTPVAGACGVFGGVRTCAVSVAGSPYGIEVVDNTRAKTGTYTVLVDQCTVPPSGPDLIATAVSNPPSTVVLKGNFSVTDTTRNQGGTAAAATKTRYYLSLDQIKSASDKRLGGVRSVPALGPGASQTGSRTVTVAASTKLGVYYLLACADDTAIVAEGANETNNCLASIATVEVKAPDLVVTAVSNPPAAATAGSSFPVTDTVQNQGNADATVSSTTRYYLSLDAKKSGSDTLLAGTRTVGPLTIGMSSSGTPTVTIPPATAANSYFLIACADDVGKQVSEANASNTGEKNNCRASATKVTVSP